MFDNYSMVKIYLTEYQSASIYLHNPLLHLSFLYIRQYRRNDLTHK